MMSTARLSKDPSNRGYRSPWSDRRWRRSADSLLFSKWGDDAFGSCGRCPGGHRISGSAIWETNSWPLFGVDFSLAMIPSSAAIRDLALILLRRCMGKSSGNRHQGLRRKEGLRGKNLGMFESTIKQWLIQHRSSHLFSSSLQVRLIPMPDRLLGRNRCPGEIEHQILSNLEPGPPVRIASTSSTITPSLFRERGSDRVSGSGRPAGQVGDNLRHDHELDTP